jgi:hypothetical protein
MEFGITYQFYAQILVYFLYNHICFCNSVKSNRCFLDVIVFDYVVYVIRKT